MPGTTDDVTKQITNIINGINQVKINYYQSLSHPSSFIEYTTLTLEDLVKNFLHAIKNIYLYFLLGDGNLKASPEEKKIILKKNVDELQKLLDIINQVYIIYNPPPSPPSSPPTPSSDDFKKTLYLGIFLSRNLYTKKDEINTNINMFSNNNDCQTYIRNVYNFINNYIDTGGKKPTSISIETFINYLVFKFILYELDFNKTPTSSDLQQRLNTCINPHSSSSSSFSLSESVGLISKINQKIKPTCS